MSADLPPELSSGYLVRDAHRAFQHELEKRIALHGVSKGQWYFLRALWIEDGLTQRELSERVGMMEPTTVIALRTMEKAGLVVRERSRKDRRKAHVWLTPKGRRLRGRLLPVARSIVTDAEKGIPLPEVRVFRRVITRMRKNLDRLRER